MGTDPHVRVSARHFDELMHAGLTAYRRGERRLAHDYWREAATIDPYSEQVWLALYRVLEADEDRAVCLQNIVAINPTNVEARRRLNVLRRRAGYPTPERSANKPRQARSRSGLIWRAILIGALAGMAGVLGGILASILIYGR